MGAKTTLAVLTILELTIVFSVALLSIFMRQFLKPFERGFYKNDESLMHPYKPSTIPSYVVYLVGFLVPLALILIIEGTWTQQRDLENRKTVLLYRKKKLTLWIVQCYRIMTLFIFGAATTHLLTNIPKYVVGRLRPHFFEVCKPDWSLVNNTSGYIMDDICTGTDEELIKESRLSFPSGHSSMAMYCSVFLILYLNKQFTWKRMTLLLPLFQLIAFVLGFYTCLSRISDYKHHWSDVLAGAILGLVIAVITMQKVTVTALKKPFSKEDPSYPLPYPAQFASFRSRPTSLSNTTL